MIKVKSDYFNIQSTLECGQVFRYKRLDSLNLAYEVISKDKRCKLYQNGQNVEIITKNEDYFYNYFNLDRDYEQIYSSLMAYEELKPLGELCKGIHILKQDLFETIISFIISANNNIKRIKGIIERISINFGTKIDDYYAFPTLNQLSKLNEEDFVNLGLGYRANYIFLAIKTLNNTNLLDEIIKMDYPSVIEYLKRLKGVGSKVADCIALFGLSHTNCYPTDVNIFKYENQTKDKTSSTIKKTALNGRTRYGYLAGFAQQWKFYAQINK